MMRKSKPATVKRLKSRGTAGQENQVALTLKVHQKTYMRLSTLRAKERTTAQDILVKALTLYLDRKGV